MLCLLYAVCVAGLTIWVIHFKVDSQGDEFIITDDLSIFNIDVHDDTTTIDREKFDFENKNLLSEYNIDVCSILHSDELKCDYLIEKHISETAKNAVLEEKIESRVILMPIAKALFFKVVNLTLQEDVKFTANEIYHVLESLSLLLKDKTCLLHAIYKNMTDNPSFFDELVNIYNEMNKYHLLQNTLSSLFVELEKHVILMITDDAGNVAVASLNRTSSKNNVCMCIGINKMIGLFPVHYFEMDADFILQNDKFLYDLYSEWDDIKKLTVIIHFSALKLTKSSENDIVANKLEELSKSEFMQLKCVRIIQLCFAHTNINFDLAFLTDKIINISCNNCIFANGIQLSNNCDTISLEDCHIKTKLVLPEHIDTVIFINVDINEEVTIKNDARHIELVNIRGYINIPANKKWYIKEYEPKWSFKRIRIDDLIKILMIDNIVFEDVCIVINQNIVEFVLKNIRLSDKSFIIIEHKVKSMHLENISGNVHIYNSAANYGLLNVLLDNGSVHIYEDIYVQDDSESSPEIHRIFELSNACIKSHIILSIDLFKISLKNVEILSGNGILILRDTICEIYIKNLHGCVLFKGIVGLDRIHFTKKDTTNEEELIFTKSRLTGEIKLEMRNNAFDSGITLSSDINSIKLSNIVCSENNVFKINNGYSSLIMYKCRGNYRIPGITYNGQNIIGMQKIESFISSLKDINTYDITMEGISFENTYVFNVDIDKLTLCNIENNSEYGCLQFIKPCRNIHMSNVHCFVKFQKLEPFDKVVLNDVRPDVLNTVLSVMARHIEFQNMKITRSIALSNLTEYVKISEVNGNTEFHTNIITINSNCKHICLERSDVFVNMYTILQFINGNHVICVNRLSRCEFVANSHLILENFKMNGDCKLVREIKSLELKNISSKIPCSSFYVLLELEDISIINCRMRTSISYLNKLRKISVIGSGVFYDPDVYPQVKYMSLVNVDINKTLVLSNIVEDIYMENVRIYENKDVVFSNDVASLYISNVAGSVNMCKTVVNHNFELKDKETIEIKKIAEDVFSLNMCKMHFATNYEFSEKIETLKLVDAKADNCVIRISNIHHVEMINCASEIKLFNSSDEIDAFIQDCGTNGLFTLSNIHTLKLQKKVFDHNFKLPSCIRTIILEDVEMTNDTLFVINQECEEVHLLSCKGKFDLIAITTLKKLAFISSMDTCDLQISDTCLHDLHELEVGGDVDDEYVISVVSSCHHLKRLTLHNPMLSYKENSDMLYLPHINKYMFFSTDNNVYLLSKMFNFNTVSKLEYLDISRLFMDSSKIKVWNHFKKLNTLVINYDSIGQVFLDHVFTNIKTIEYVENYNWLDIFDAPSYVNNVENNIKRLKTLKYMNNLVIPQVFCHGYNILCYLPPFIEKLTIELHNCYIISDCDATETKICVKELVLNTKFDNHIDILKPKNFSKRYYVVYFDYLQKFIDFDGLEKLIVETRTGTVCLDTVTYQIK